MKPKFVVKISMGESGTPAKRQLPGLEPRWGEYKFEINKDVKKCDAWIIWGNLYKEEQTTCPKENILFFAAEPSSVHSYNKDFLKQFHTIVTSDRHTGHPNPIYYQQALPWWVGHKFSGTDDAKLEHTYDELSRISEFKKTKLISVIASNKTFTKGHRQRLKLAQKLKQHFGDKIDLFGAGFNPINDKWDAIAPYKYHITIENSAFDDYWTEKLADSVLGGAYTFYYGCPNLNRYFSNKIYSPIDVNDPAKTIATIEKTIEENTYEKSVEQIQRARELILEKYQLFPTICDFCSKMTGSQKDLVILKPESAFDSSRPTFLGKILNKIR